MDAALLVVNERARGATHDALLGDAVRLLRQAYRVRVVAPASRAELATAVRASGEPLVIAGGGDGTVNAVAAALPHGATLGIMPVGTANDFARELGIPASAPGAAQRLVATRGHAPYAADLVVVNGRPFCTVGGVGLVTRTTAAVLRLKAGNGAGRGAAQLLGTLVYKLAAAATIVAGRDLVDALRVSYRDASGRWNERVVLAHALFVVNHCRCGGGLALPTGSRGDDGVFELGIVHAGSRLALARNFSRLASGAAVPGDAFEVLRATEARISSDVPLPFAADGELLATARALAVHIRPGALPVAGVATPS